LGDVPGQLAGDHLEHDGDRAGLLEFDRVGKQPVGFVAPSLDAVPTERVLALRGEADVAEDRDARFGDLAHLVAHLAAALELDRVGEAFLHEPHGGVECLLR